MHMLLVRKLHAACTQTTCCLYTNHMLLVRKLHAACTQTTQVNRCVSPEQVFPFV